MSSSDFCSSIEYDDAEKALIAQREALREDLIKVMGRWADINQLIRQMIKLKNIYIEEAKPISQQMHKLDADLADHFIERTGCYQNEQS